MIPDIPCCWSKIVEVTSLTPNPPGKPDKTPSIPDIKYIIIALDKVIDVGEITNTSSHKIKASIPHK